MAEWLISGNPQKYDVISAFKTLGSVDWVQSSNIRIGDTVYIYVSGTIKALRFKCSVKKVDMPVPEIDDQIYNISGEFDGKKGRYMELEMEEEFTGDEYTRENLMQYGFTSPMGPVHMPDSVKAYLNSVRQTAHMRKYPVNTSVWLATALLSMELFEKNPDAPLSAYYFKQSDITQRAQPLSVGNVQSARCSYYCCAEQIKKSNNYLRGDFPGQHSARRLTRMNEFSNHTYPTGLNDTDILIMDNKKITMKDLFSFVKDKYSKVVDDITQEVDYIGILEYVQHNREIPYTNPDSPQITPEKKAQMLEIKKRGQYAQGELKKIADFCASRFHLNKCMPISWLDGSCTKTRKYLWAQMKYEQYQNDPTSISVFVESTGSTPYFRISLEIKNDSADADSMAKYHSHLDIPLDTKSGLVYASGASKLGHPIPINKSQDEIKSLLKSGTYSKVQVCKYIHQEDGMTNAYFQAAILAAVDALLPYYEYVIGKSKLPIFEKIDIVEDNMDGTTEEFAKNLILYGPPGTGKTYYSAIYAVAICDKRSIASVKQLPYDQVMERYSQLKCDNRIAFTTFHQSYGYEEFIEGIKPEVSNKTNDISYKVEDGIFKKFCETAGNTCEFHKYKNARVWCILLDGTGNSMLKTDCFENNCIRIGWPNHPTIITEETENLNSIERRILLNFQDQIAIGDVIVTEYSNTEIDGIGVVTGNAEFDESFTDFPRKRSVKWFMRKTPTDILEMNQGIHLDRKSVYELDHLDPIAILALANSQNDNKDSIPYVFIIDEINRGNISKIFGELITLIEDTKRSGMREAASAILPYSNTEFSVPANVYILGTMNTADRSIALMDTALRRRFQFIEMMPDSNVLVELGANYVQDLNVAQMLDTINDRISYLYDREHTIGHAFFTKLADNPTIECLANIFQKSVIPLLQEYFYEDYQKIQLVLGDNGKESNDIKFIADEQIKTKNIFKGNADDLVDLPDKKYYINNPAFLKLQSYKDIM